MFDVTQELLYHIAQAVIRSCAFIPPKMAWQELRLLMNNFFYLGHFDDFSKDINTLKCVCEECGQENYNC